MNPYFESIDAKPGVHGDELDPFEILGFEFVVLTAGGTHTATGEGRETAVVVLTGTVDVRVGDREFTGVGGRARVFDGPPSMVYVPTGETVLVSTADGAEVALCSARTEPGAPAREPYRVDAADVVSGTWGGGATTRSFDFMIDADRPSDRLFLAEVTVRDGNWATYPPHKHERGSDEEIFQEEYYFYRVDPEQGFGFSGLYGGQVGGEHASVIRDNTIQKIPYGYHTVTAAPGYAVWYLAAYAGESKQARPCVDPDHRWYTPPVDGGDRR